MRNKLKELSNGMIRWLVARSIVRDTIITTALGGMGRSAMLFIPFFISAWFGISEDTDAFFFVLGVLVFFSGVFAWAVEAVVVPFVVKLEREGHEQVGNFVGGILLVVGFFLTSIWIFLLLVAKPLFSLLTNFSEDSIKLLWVLLLEISPVIILTTASGILSGVLNAYKAFRIPALSTSLSLFLVLGIAYLSKAMFGIHAIVLGYILGEICRFFFLLWAFRQNGIGPMRFSFQQGGTVYEFLRTSIYMIIGMSIGGLPPIINRTIASYFGAGSVSVLEYAEKMFYIPAGILNSGFLIVIFSYWSSRFPKGESERFWKDVIRVTKLAIVLSLVATVFLFAFRYHLTSIAIGRGKIPEEKIAEVGQLFGVYLLGLLPNIINLILGRAHLVLKNTEFLMKATFIGVVVLLLLNAKLTPRLGLIGIALALAGSQTMVSLLLYLMLKKFFEGTNGSVKRYI